MGKFDQTLKVDRGYMGKRYITISDMLVCQPVDMRLEKISTDFF